MLETKAGKLDKRLPMRSKTYWAFFGLYLWGWKGRYSLRKNWLGQRKSQSMLIIMDPWWNGQSLINQWNPAVHKYCPCHEVCSQNFRVSLWNMERQLRITCQWRKDYFSQCRYQNKQVIRDNRGYAEIKRKLLIFYNIIYLIWIICNLYIYTWKIK